LDKAEGSASHLKKMNQKLTDKWETKDVNIKMFMMLQF
jgi:hypothetical protein